MGAISPLHLLIVLIVALVVIGPRKLPETGAALGKALREFREATRDDPTPATPAVPAQAAEAHDPAATSGGPSGTSPEA
jgi:sec-independent protein translocase protein TatA